MSTRTILFASPREPSGASWLINCLLELGARVDFQPTADRVWRSARSDRLATAMWQQGDDGRWSLHPRAEALTKWLPILGRQDTLALRDDFEALYVQDLPRAGLTGDHTLLFVRDPRDAIHSSYRRFRPDMSLAEYVRFPHHETLLDVIDHWRVFVESWLARPGTHVYRFEDYKSDDVALLTRIVGDLSLDASPSQIEAAAAESTYTKAREQEERYRSAHPGDDEVAMRAGQVGEWQNVEDARALSIEIEARAGSLLQRLGYDVAHLRDEGTQSYVSQLSLLKAFDDVDLAPDLRVAASASDPLRAKGVAELLQLASSIDASFIARAKLPAREARILLDSLQEYVDAWRARQAEHLIETRAAFADGADYRLARMKGLLTERRAERAAQDANDLPRL